MLNHDVYPVGGCMLSCRVIEDYDPWKRIAEIFSRCPLSRLKDGLWDMFKAAVLDREVYPSRDEIGTLTVLCEHVNELVTGIYFVASERLPDIQEKQTGLSMFPGGSRDPWNSIERICYAYESYEMRDELWQMFQSAISEKGHDLSKEERRNMIALYEHLTDLAHAGYVITKEKAA